LITLVEAPNFQLYDHWVRSGGRDVNEYRYIETAAALKGWHGPVIVLNGGSHDPHVRSLVKHPSRAGNVTHMEV
jgi:hypothetical protein